MADEAGKLLAKGTFESSYLLRGSCNLLFRVNDVPGGASFYRVQVAHQSESTYTEAEAKAGIDITVGGSEAGSTTTTSMPSPTTTSTQPSTTKSATPDPEQTALNQLQATAAADKRSVATYLADRWVPQLSSKRVGLVAEGTVWTNAKILQEHLRLRAQYPDVRLLWSSEWSTFKPGFWVTVAGIYYTDYPGALAWCTNHGFDRDHCYAKLISTTHGVDGSTEFNR